MSNHQTTEFKRSLGLLDGVMLVAGSMIGSGIFIVSADITRHVGSPGYLLLVWALTGVLTLIAAVSYGELSAMFPRAGGQYTYLREAYNPLVGFLYGWAFFAVIQTGTIAAVGVGFSKFAAYIWPVLSEKNILLDLGSIKISAAQLVSIGMIVLLSFINSMGIQQGKWIQLLFTFAKLASIFGLIAAGLWVGSQSDFWSLNWANGWVSQSIALTDTTVSSTPIVGFMAVAMAIGVASVGSIFSSDSWNNVTFIAGEIKNPQRNIGLSLALGTAIVTAIYLLMNIMYLMVLPLDGIAFAASDRVGVAAAEAIFGSNGTIIIAVMIMVSTFGCNNGLILSGARVYYTMAQDGLFFKNAGLLNANSVPEKAIWFQCVWASLLCLTGRYGDLLDYVCFVVLIFYILTIAGIFKLRRSRPDAERPYRAFGYPILPIIYIILASFICITLLIEKPEFTWPGLGIVLAGIPLYYWAIGQSPTKK